jgi:hypothetical protein
MLDLIFSVLGPHTQDLCFFAENIPDGHTEFEYDGSGDIDGDIVVNSDGTGVVDDDWGSGVDGNGNGVDKSDLLFIVSKKLITSVDVDIFLYIFI